jgi:hypothetical protein
MEFMAIEVPQGVSHTYRHGSKSFSYISPRIRTRRGSKRFSSGKVSHDRVSTWRNTGDYEQIADAKEGKWIKLSDVVDTTETRKLQETICNGFPSDENTIKSVDVAWLG